MEPKIYKPSIYKGAGIYKIGTEGGSDFDLTKFVVTQGTAPKLQNFSSAGNLVWRLIEKSTGWFWTPEIDLNAATTIKEEWNFTVEQFENIENGSIGMGEWYNTNATQKAQFSIYIYSDRIIVTYGSITTETFYINYSLGTKVKVLKYIDQLTANIKVYYEGILVVDFSTSRNNLILGNYRFHIGGLRKLITDYGFMGTMDFKKCYIEIDNNIMWGVKS